jgi:RNA polymerase sigma-70 factor (ECF subfamily)
VQHLVPAARVTGDTSHRTGNPEVVTGDPPDFDELYASSFTGVAVQLYAYFGDLAEAQDVTQEAFCRAWQRWATVSRYDDPVAWVRKVAWRLAISRWRRIKTAVLHVRRSSEVHAPALDGVRVDVVRALAQLPADQRRAIVLHHLAGLSTSEIAADAGVADGTVRSWLTRGRAALRSQLALVDPIPGEHDLSSLKEVR